MVRDEWVFVTTEWNVLGLQIEKRIPDMKGTWKYI
jgi:hypothetical protein